MSDLKLHRTEVSAANGETIRLVYDENGDMLDVFWVRMSRQQALNLPITFC